MSGFAEKSRVYRRRRAAVVLALVLALVGFVLFDDFSAQRAGPNEVGGATLASTVAEGANAIEVLGKLAVRESVSKAGYSRNQFSPGWGDLEGCDMRNRILQRDLKNVVLDTNNCTVLSGVLEDDPFTGNRIEFSRGAKTSGSVHIEHLVAVSDAWQKGAQALPEEKRWEFYNDPLNLIAVSGAANMAKGDKDVADWLPVRKYRCRYVARQIAVKRKYALWVTKLERNAMKRVLMSCPSQPLPLQTLIKPLSGLVYS
jgi:hypothetical protein